MCQIWLMSGWCFYIYPPPLGVSVHGHSFLNNGLDNTEWDSLISDLYSKLRIISRGVLSFDTGSPCGVWGRGWITRLLYVGPRLGPWFWFCNYGIVKRILLIIFFYHYLVLVCFFHLPSFACFFPLYNYFFYRDYFVLPYSIDVVSTLPYHIISLHARISKKNKKNRDDISLNFDILQWNTVCIGIG